MTIWCISKYASVPKYGTAPRLFYLAKGFISLGHKAILITSDANHFAKYPETDKTYNHEEVEGVSVCWIRTRKYRKTASISRILSWLDFERRLFFFDAKTLPKPEVVIVSSLSIFTVLFGIYLKRKFSSRLVFEVRDIWPLTMTEEGGFTRWHPLVLLIGLIEKLGYKHADLIVGTMPKLDMHVRNILGYDRPFLCSPLGFNPDDYQKTTASESNPFSATFPKGKIIIGYAGSMGITNALEPFIGAIKLLRDHAEIHFMLVGGGDLRPAFEKELYGCGNVTFLPKISQGEVKSFLAKCDILYLSTKNSRVWEYGQSMNKVVEYMLSGKPIMASYAGFPSMINEAGCGRFIPISSPEALRDVILELIALGQAALVKMGADGREWVWEHRRYPILSKWYIDRLCELRASGTDA
jgi:glycosyltransferase involved in cell wall biosynthesis